ncbi:MULTISPECIES: 23S rRNA pseudouridine(2604) synthase RluF [Halomonadaceae]|uniref:23S rRNA pseudouridine(2604) synthase RluF n=1 Tax=Halomonadaceae TaxID=28256 RepID=UPI0015835055|nr:MULTISPECIES: 23S rRNA pseudouridine(2604) synthase RluF [Halomonas]MDI4638611.1 23S rRNA pseudouridine(2604) synthase RluF [Halomonas sp. BMC7]NUJ59597.1 23S rRNA pseudouridine(2604) synthase RluF [Halomonas taeanensis]
MALDSSDTRLNKFISETGIVSRREADRLIEEGAVKVNGRRAEMGMRVTDADRVTVRGKPLRAKPRPVYLLYNKPVGVTCTTDPADPTNIVDAINYPERIFPIGRLDKPSQGLILLTNDGDIVNKILRAGNAHEKEYQVRVDRPIDQAFIERMGAGIPILGTVTQPCPVRQTGPNSFTIVLTQGLNRQIRRMTEYLGYEVTYLKRVRLMNIHLNRLSPGQWRELSDDEMATLEGMLGDSRKTEEASLPKRKAKSAKQGAGKPGAKRTDKPNPGKSAQGKSAGKPGSSKPKRAIRQGAKVGEGKQGDAAKPKRASQQAGKPGAGKPTGKGGQGKSGAGKQGPNKPGVGKSGPSKQGQGKKEQGKKGPNRAGGGPAKRSPRGRS